MTETIIHIVDGEPVLNPEPEPTEPRWSTSFSHISYIEALAEWKKNCKPCENVKKFYDASSNGEWFIVNPRNSYPSGLISNYKRKHEIIPITPGQKVLAEGSVVRKIV